MNSDWTRTGRRTGIMLAYPFEEKRLLRWTPPYLLQPKLDGERCRVQIDSDGVVRMFSSEANLIESVPHIQGAFEVLSERLNLRSVELDGELYCHGLPLETIHSIVSRKVDLHPEFESIQFHCFDLVDEDRPQIQRHIRLLDFFSNVSDATYELSLVPFQLVYARDSILSQLEWALEEGYEGIIVRHLDAPYVRRRSTFMMKFKPKKEDIYEIIAVTEELSQHGEPKARLGALICRAQEGEETFHVGTGYSADKRAELWTKRALLPGKRVQVKYQHLTSARGVPRSAVFVEILE